MWDDIVERWLASARFAEIEKIRVRPVPHRLFPGKPLAIQRGQAVALVLQADDGTRWILKKFLAGKGLDRAYLCEVTRVLPRHPALSSGTDRRVLSASSIASNGKAFHEAAFTQWLDGTILMPRVEGCDWTAVADGLRDGSLQLQPSHRLALCHQLCELVAVLETAGCAHRDLSGGNVFIDATQQRVALIDFDSVFHRDLRMPPATTCGTMGYAPPFVWQNGRTEPASTWRIGADRFALTILNVEFLTLGSGAPLAGEGGLFEQSELSHGLGAGVAWARDVLRRDYPPLEDLFRRALTAHAFEDCPTAAEWLPRLDQVRGGGSRAPSLADLPQLPAADFEDLLARRRSAAPIWPAPRLDEMKEAFLTVQPVAAPRLILPPDPWSRV